MIADLLPPRLTVVAADQGGVFTMAQAAAVGIDRHEMSRGVSAGLVHRIRRGAYIAADHWAHADEQARHVLTARAVLLGLRAPCAVSHGTAVLVRGFGHHELVFPTVHVTHDVGRGSSRQEAGVTHHLAGLPPEDHDVVTGLPTTTGARTAVDVARHHPFATAVVVADQVLARGTTRAVLRQALLDQSDHPGARAAARAITVADGRSESVGETLGRLAFRAVDLLPDQLQMLVQTDRGTYHTDYAWTRWRLVGEFDGRIKYGRLLEPGQTTQDVLCRERQRELAIERAGWLVVRFTWAEVFNRGLVRARLLEAMGRSRSLGLTA